MTILFAFNFLQTQLLTKHSVKMSYTNHSVSWHIAQKPQTRRTSKPHWIATLHTGSDINTYIYSQHWTKSWNAVTPVITGLLRLADRRRGIYTAVVAIFRCAARPTLVGTGGSGCSAWPTVTCSSCGTSGCSHPTPLQQHTDYITRYLHFESAWQQRIAQYKSDHHQFNARTTVQVIKKNSFFCVFF